MARVAVVCGGGSWAMATKQMLRRRRAAKRLLGDQGYMVVRDALVWAVYYVHAYPDQNMDTDVLQGVGQALDLMGMSRPSDRAVDQIVSAATGQQEKQQ